MEVTFTQKNSIVGRLEVSGNQVEGDVQKFPPYFVVGLQEAVSGKDPEMNAEDYCLYQSQLMSNALQLVQTGSGLRVSLDRQDGVTSNLLSDRLPHCDTDTNTDEVSDAIFNQALDLGRSNLSQWLNQITSWLDEFDSAEAAIAEIPNLYDQLNSRRFTKALEQHMILADLQGRAEVLEEEDWRGDAQTPDFLKLSFLEAIAAFRKRISMPIGDYRDLGAAYHDWAFSVSGLTKAELLDDTKYLLDKSLSEGASYETFTQQFDRLVGRKGWQPEGNRDRRLYTIFDQNIRGSYGSGRREQMTDPMILERRPLWLWRWRDSPNPRPIHQSLHNKAIPAKHKFWDAIRKLPCGWGCRCTYFAINEDYAQRNGIQILSDPPAPETVADPAFLYQGAVTDEEVREAIVNDGIDRLSSEELKEKVRADLELEESTDEA